MLECDVLCSLRKAIGRLSSTGCELCAEVYEIIYNYISVSVVGKALEFSVNPQTSEAPARRAARKLHFERAF